jgi:hypothetical protein
MEKIRGPSLRAFSKTQASNEFDFFCSGHDLGFARANYIDRNHGAGAIA